MKFPIGIQTFEEIITGGYVYVDKTGLGYLTIKNYDNDGGYPLGFPNEDVADGFVRYY